MQKGRRFGDPFSTDGVRSGVDAVLQRFRDGELYLLVGGLGYRLASGGVAYLTLRALATDDLAQTRQGDGTTGGDLTRDDSGDGVKGCVGGFLVCPLIGSILVTEIIVANLCGRMGVRCPLNGFFLNKASIFRPRRRKMRAYRKAVSSKLRSLRL